MRLQLTFSRIALVGERARRDDGQALVEYALILGLVCVVAIVLLTAMGASVTSLLAEVTAALNSALS
jgi:Flp pilus assembly pilin Flp